MKRSRNSAKRIARKTQILAEAHNGLGDALDAEGAVAWRRWCSSGRPCRAKSRLRRRPHNNLGNALGPDGTGRMNEAIAEFETALRLKPDFPAAHNGLGRDLVPRRPSPRGPAAIHAKRFASSLPIRWRTFNLANVLAATGHLSPRSDFRNMKRPCASIPKDALAHNNFGSALALAGKDSRRRRRRSTGRRCGCGPILTRARVLLEQLDRVRRRRLPASTPGGPFCRPCRGSPVP